MELFSSAVKVYLPNYLQNLPIPDSFIGWFKLGITDWLKLIPPTAILAGFTYMSYLAFCPKCRRPPPGAAKINFSVQKSAAKIADQVDIESIADKAVFCRCWKSNNWPYCDGSHNLHNKNTGDNIGPLIVKRKAT